MPLPRTNAAPPREIPTAEPHQAVCIGHYHIGSQHSEKYGKDDDQIVLSFALLDCRRSDGSYFYVSTFPLTLTYDDRANLTKLLKGWIGRVPAMGEEFDTSTLLRKQCFLTITHNQGSEGGTYANIAGVMALPKSVPELRYDEDFNDYSPIDPSKPIPEWVPQSIARKIRASTEWVAVHGEPPKGNGQQNGAANGHANGNGHSAVSQSGVQPLNGPDTRPSYSPPPATPPMVVKPYMMVLGLKWPYKVRELDEALERGKASNTEAELAEADAALRPHADEVPF
jgi:hypothetical protein